MAEQGDHEYVERLGEVLHRRDPAVLRAFLESSAAHFGDQRQVDAIRAKDEAEMLELMHRMILARGDLADLHPESRRWLEARQGRAAPRGRPRGGNHEVH